MQNQISKNELRKLCEHVPCKVSMIAIKDSSSPASSEISEVCLIKLGKRVVKFLESAVCLLLMRSGDEPLIGAEMR